MYRGVGGDGGGSDPPELKNRMRNSSALIVFQLPDLVTLSLSWSSYSVFFWSFLIFLMFFHQKSQTSRNFTKKYSEKFFRARNFYSLHLRLYFVVLLYMCPIIWGIFDLQSHYHGKGKNWVFWFHNSLPPTHPQHIGLGT